MKPCAECESNPRAPGKARCVGCIDAVDWFDRERRRQRVALEDCETCAYRSGDRCAYYPPLHESKQPLTPGRCNYWLPVADADLKPAEADDEDPDPADDDVSYNLSVDGAASVARDYKDDEYEEYDGYRPCSRVESGHRRWRIPNRSATLPDSEEA